ncbi:hypothetical protein LCGC14_2714410 [marine sediment metagenome]|uniref:Uncharacterized protein n=1 Tax=marine sediment metagenome TaxID=412755 RepID=A0A0F9BL13_9ZZZZ
MTVEFPFNMGQAVRIEGENKGQVRGLWIDFDGVHWVYLRYKDATGVLKFTWSRATDCEAV